MKNQSKRRLHIATKNMTDRSAKTSVRAGDLEWCAEREVAQRVLTHAAIEEGVMGKKLATKGNPQTRQKSAVRDLRPRRLPTGQAGEIKGGLITEATMPGGRRSKNEVAVETLEIAHAGFDS